MVVIADIVIIFLLLDCIAGWCLVPLAIWVVFAAVLNFSI
jgi:tryptophan-rich sensory protein